MLEKIVELSLRYKFLILVGFVVVAFLGWRAVTTVPLDAYPEITPVQVNIYTESPGLAAEDVEKLLTLPIESAMAGLPSVREIRSVSMFGLSYVTVYFEDDMDIYFARRLVNARLQQVSERIPEGYGSPQLGPNTSGLGQVFWYTLERKSDKFKDEITNMDLRTLQDWTVRRILRTVPGVADVTSWGGHVRQYQAVIDPQMLIKYNLTFNDIISAIEANNAQVGGQYTVIGKERYLIRGLGLIQNEKDIGQIVLKVRDGDPVYLRDVATIQQAPAPRFGAVTRDGQEVVFGMVLSRIGANAQEVVQGVKQKMETVKKALPDGVVIKPIYSRTTIVNKAIDTATSALIEGAILVALILFLFLGDLRSSIVVIASLPLSMLIAFIFMNQFGMSANLMSLAGLAIGMGMMVDGAVVLTENAFRIMAERRERGEQVNRTSAVLAAAREVINPVAFAILIIIVVFLPLFSLQGLEGKLFKPMAFNISFAMAGSLLLTLTLIPVLAALLLKPKQERDTRLMQWIYRGFRPMLTWALANRVKVAGGAGVLLVAVLALVPFMGKAFMPTLQEGDIMWRVTSIPSISLQQSIEVSETIEKVLNEFSEVATTVAMVGRAEQGETADVNYMEVYTKLKPEGTWETGRDITELRYAMGEALEKAVPTAMFSFTQPIQMRVEELTSGVGAPLAAKLYGEDLQTLDRLSQQIKEVLESVPGVADLALEANVGKPQIRIRVDRNQLARYGLNADDVLTIVEHGIGNAPITTLVDGVRRFDITARFGETAKESLTAIRQLPLQTPGGAVIPLEAVADVTVDVGYSFIRHEKLQRYSVIKMDVRGRDVVGFVQEAKAAIAAGIDMPSGYWIEWGGAFENQQRAMARLMVIVPITIFFIFVLLYTAFNSARYAALIIANVPFATIGGILGLFLTGQYLSVPSAIGFIAVFGVAMLNGIVLVSFINELRDDGVPLHEAVWRGTMLRLRPVLMTASVAILGLIPMLISSGVGAEVQRPLATVVVFGLITSTLLTLVLLPTIYEWMEERRQKRVSHEED